MTRACRPRLVTVTDMNVAVMRVRIEVTLRA